MYIWYHWQINQEDFNVFSQIYIHFTSLFKYHQIEALSTKK